MYFQIHYQLMLSVGIHTLVIKYMYFKIMKLFQAFTNNSKAFKDRFCPKKRIKKEGETTK